MKKTTNSKKNKLILIIFCSILVLWLAIGITDFALVQNYHKPLFCVGVNLADDGGSGRYIGLGYGFDLEGNFMPDAKHPGVTSYHGYLLGKEVSRGFWDEMRPGTKPFTGTFKEPPALTVICGESSTKALQGTYSWHYNNWNGTISGVEADCIHPLEAKELMTPLNFVPSFYSHIDPFTVYLQFDVVPDSVTISYWGEECWGQTDAAFKEKDVAVTKTEDTDAVGNPLILYSFQRGEENAIYMISAAWESYENFNGTATYSFYTTYPLLEAQPIVP